MNTLRVVKEPIHDYVVISDLETAILNDPLFQRLHHVTQNGTAYLTYPSNRTSRLVHSLGVMHVGGQMLCCALFDSDASIRSSLGSSFMKALERASADVSFRLDQVQKYLNATNDLCYRHFGFGAETDVRVAETILFQSVRIACVLHDIGHLPFSHTTEHVLTSKVQSSAPSEAAKEEYQLFLESLGNLRREELGQAQKLHENIGTALVGHIFSEITGDRRSFAQLCFWFANRIANEGLTSDADGLFACLHSIVSSKGFDSDRGDYVLRDGYASSFEFGEYDLKRILQNLRFIQSNGQFQLVFTTAATSALESFFLERYRVWRWLVFHHSVVRGEVALSRALTILLEIFFASDRSDAEELAVKNILERWDFRRLWKPFSTPSTYREYVRADEPWLLSIFHEIQHDLGTGPLPRRLAMLRVYLDFLLARKKSNFVTLWKRAEEYEEFCGAAQKSVQKALSKFKGKKAAELKPIARREDESNTQWFNRVMIPVLSDSSTGEIEAMRQLEHILQDILQKKFRSPGALLFKVLDLSPKVECILVDKAGKELPIETLSSIVESLPEAWNKDMQLRAYWVGLKEEKMRYTSSGDQPCPTRGQLGSVFLDAILGGQKYENLRRLARF